MRARTEISTTNVYIQAYRSVSYPRTTDADGNYVGLYLCCMYSLCTERIKLRHSGRSSLSIISCLSC
jgi:hypothetical protein